VKARIRWLQTPKKWEELSRKITQLIVYLPKVEFFAGHPGSGSQTPLADNER